MPRALAIVALALLVAGPSRAGELPLLGRHPLSGQADGTAYTGEVELRPDATFTIERRFPDARRERVRGRVRVEGRSLWFEPAPPETPEDGAAAPASEPAAALRYDLDEGGERVLLRAAEADETIDLGPAEGTIALVGRALAQGEELRWLALRNRGWVEERDDGLWIQRSRQPRPADILEFKRAGGRTVLSLNGDQDRDEWLVRRFRTPMGRRRTVRTRVNLRDFIREQGLEHRWVRLGSRRAPTPAELVEVFSVLLDDSLRPILLHCTGGADRTGVIAALYEIELLGRSKEEAKQTMRRHMWTAARGTAIQGAVIDLYQRGALRDLLRAAGVEIPARYEPR